MLLFLVSTAALQGQAPQSQKSEAANTTHRYTNRLIHETSPYLLLHAHNPVDWYPWGEEAFAKARRENKPIFLSVGYYTCHWCHVMERESYSNPEIATVLNRSFVAIKVDREERPDVDSTYMAFVEATTGSGGWPMNVLLTPELKPFFGGTYFAPDELKQLLTHTAGLWRKDRGDIEKSAGKISSELQRSLPNAASGSALSPQVLDKTFQQIKQTYDPEHPGFGDARRFPRPVVPEFLLRYWKHTGNRDALEMTFKTLHAMAAGGVHDQLGGGFHRYSTDADWRVPHFEKMLYDQAQLAAIYTEAFQITRDPFYADVTRDILDFTLREMRDPAGGFYSALDADSPIAAGNAKSGEGAFYVWTAGEIEQTLGPGLAPIFEFRYGVRKEGNVRASQDIEGWLQGKNVLYEEHSVEETAARFGRMPSEIKQLVAGSRERLLAVRGLRPRPPVDTKVITAWNGMMISALARASRVLNEPRYLDAAKRAQRLIETRLYQADSGRLMRRYRSGVIGIEGYPDDYASAIKGSLDLYEASFDPSLLSFALKLQRKQDELFWDNKNGGYFNTTGADKALLWRSREIEDDAEPAAASTSALNLIWMWQLTDDNSWKEKADKVFAAASSALERSPEAVPLLAAAFGLRLAKHQQIVIAGAPAAADTATLLALVWQRFLPDAVVFLVDGGAVQRELAHYLPVTEHMGRQQGKATAYICENYVCNLPTADPKIAERILDGSR